MPKPEPATEVVGRLRDARIVQRNHPLPQIATRHDRKGVLPTPLRLTDPPEGEISR